MAESKLAQGHMNGAGAIERALKGYNAPGSVDYHQTLEKVDSGITNVSEKELLQYRKPPATRTFGAVARALNK